MLKYSNVLTIYMYFLSFFLLFFLLFFIIFYSLLKHQKDNIIGALTSNIEALTNNVDVVLMGDSMLENGNYVDDGYTVGANIKKTHKKTIVLARDESVVNDIDGQLKQFPTELDNKNTYVFLSIGGNDLLEIYKYGAGAGAAGAGGAGAGAAGAGKASVNDLSHLDSTFKKYKGVIESIKKKYKFNLVLLNIYYPKEASYVKFHNIIKIWNQKLLSFSNKNNLDLLDVSKILYKKKHFTNGIEPSMNGSVILANNITSF
jgi:lysophospholipase L1-like esterase